MTSFAMVKRTTVEIEACIARIASRQYGLVSREQAGACGATRGMLDRRISTGRWQVVLPAVYRLPGTSLSWRQQAMARLLYAGPDSALCGATAAFVAELTNRRPKTIDVLMPRARHRGRIPGTRLHTTAEPLRKRDVLVVEGLRMTGPARTLLDVAAWEQVATLEGCIDEAIRRGLLTLARLEQWLATLPPRTRGARVLRAALAPRTDAPTESPLERRFRAFLRSRGLPLPVTQHRVYEGDVFVGRVDCAYPHARLAIELDSFRFHDRRDSFDGERARGNDLLALGWNVLRITARHLDASPDDVERWLALALPGHRAEP